MTTAAARTQSTARFLRGALLFVFATATILPFCTSFFLCAMPCCHRAPSPQSAMTAPMAACPGSSSEGCAPTISATANRTSATPAAPTTTSVNLPAVTVAVMAPQITATNAAARAPAPASSAPLHVLNSVFRI